MLQEVDRSSSESDSDIATTEPEENSPLGKEPDHHLKAPATARDVEGASASSISGSNRTHNSPSTKSKIPHSSKSSNRKHTSRKSFGTTGSSKQLASGSTRGESSRKGQKTREIEPPGAAKNIQSSESDTVDSA